MQISALGRARVATTAGLAFLACWVLLAGVDPSGWLVGAPVIVIAAATAALMPPADGTTTAHPQSDRVTSRPGAVALLMGAFLRDSVRGAIDVGIRSLARNPKIDPQIVRWRTALRSSFARLLLLHATSLVPGTLTVRIEGDDLYVHVLDTGWPWRPEMQRLEARLAAAFEFDAGVSR